ncbi:hypothetical protein [Aeromonas caviae]|uniref:Uncharacterized protein n=1 Tax=Aeromonas caviae TaxID=648 RepID=A0AA43ALC6_AERCA|nr:hypothetical protein [Aeromonas caviae]MDH1900647.1 hypothetical protein [Aeromonas caviae]
MSAPKNGGITRVFRKLDTLVLYLQQIGVSRFEVDAAGFIVAPKPLRGV